jgi:hypothetical protein
MDQSSLMPACVNLSCIYRLSTGAEEYIARFASSCLVFSERSIIVTTTTTSAGRSTMRSFFNGLNRDVPPEYASYKLRQVSWSSLSNVQRSRQVSIRHCSTFNVVYQPTRRFIETRRCVKTQELVSNTSHRDPHNPLILDEYLVVYPHLF